MKSLIKLKINHKAETGREIPWELIYLVKKDEIEIGKKLFKYYLIVQDDTEVKSLLDDLDFNHLGMFGMDRSETISEDLRPNKKLKDIVKLEEYSLLIPLLSKGKKAGKKTLRYFSSKQYRRGLREAHNGYKESNKEMPKVLISAGEDLEGHPCTNCSNLHMKIMDPKACHLGSSECLSNILIGKGSDFNTSLNIVEGMK